MDIPSNVVVDEAQNNADWPDFSLSINEIAQQEQAEQVGEDDAPGEPIEEANPEAMTMFLNAVFGLIETATSTLSKVEFEFDEKAKGDVIDAAIPVFSKYSDLGMFSDYLPEATLLFTVVILTYSSRCKIAELKQLKEVEGEKAQAPITA